MIDEPMHEAGSYVGHLERELRRTRVLLAHAWGLLDEEQARGLLGIGHRSGWARHRSDLRLGLQAQVDRWLWRFRATGERL